MGIPGEAEGSRRGVGGRHHHRCGHAFKAATWLHVHVHVLGNKHSSSADMVGMLQSPRQGLAESEGSQSFWKSKAKCVSFLFFLPLITLMIIKSIWVFSLGLHFFQAMLVTVNNCGWSRNRSYGLIGTAWNEVNLSEKGNCGRFWNNFAWDNVLSPQDSCAEARTWLNVGGLHAFVLSFPFLGCSSHTASATF